MKKIHIAGPCIPHKHYMADISTKLEAILKMIDNGEYFIINRPRQYGKTTMLYMLTREIQKNEDFLVIPISFEGLGEIIVNNEAKFCHWFFRLMAQVTRFIQKKLAPILQEFSEQVGNMKELSFAITNFVEQADKKIVLLIDEVDQSSKHDVFLKFLGVLRDKYIKAENGFDFTFHNVILAGVHDIQNLKVKIRSDTERKLNSPWNIASEFKVDMSFHTSEITPMLEEYAARCNVKMDMPTIAQKLFDYTSGYPFLVSKICKVVDEQIIRHTGANSWSLADLEIAVQQIVKEENFNFGSLIKNLENNTDLYRVVEEILLGSKTIAFNIHNPLIKMGVTYGIFKDSGILRIHNQIYEQIIYNYMISKTETIADSSSYHHYGQFELPNHRLDIDGILLKFQSFMKEQYTDRDQKFIEREGRLIFLAFLKPILNGKGHTFIEPQISDEKRLDIVITYYQHKYIIELKLWYGAKTHEKGLKQLADYLDRQNQQKGWLLIFEHQRKKTWNKKNIQKHKKDILVHKE